MLAKMLVQMVLWYGFIGALLFVSAGTVQWPAAWAYLIEMVVLSLVIGLILLKRDPGLLNERLSAPLQKQQSPADKIVLPIVLLVLLGSYAFYGLDAVRFRWSSVSGEVQLFGAGLLLVFVLLNYWTMRVNSFAAPVVKIQKERGQTVITSGPYRVVRHPFYVGALLFSAGSSLMLGSLWGLLFVPLLALLLAIRITFEERALIAGLDGYEDYVRRVRYRLIPLVW